MKIAVTGATGFLGRYVVNELLRQGNSCRCWFRSASSRYSVTDVEVSLRQKDSAVAPEATLEWVPGELGVRGDQDFEWACGSLVKGCDAVVHAGLHRHGRAFQGTEGDVGEYIQKNVGGTIQLIEAAIAHGVPRFVFISTCAVHETILSDRPLDEAHPTWMKTHYGASKAAVEQFVSSYGRGHGYQISALRPCGIYGLHHVPQESRWYGLIEQIVQGTDVTCHTGGKVVHAADVARAVQLLLRRDDCAGEVFSCCEGYVSELEVATIARALVDSDSRIHGVAGTPKHQIICDKIKALGFQFGKEQLLKRTIQQMIDSMVTPR